MDSLLARPSLRPPSAEVLASLAAIQASRAAAELRLQRDSLRVRLLTMAVLALVAGGTFALAGHLRARRHALAAARAAAAAIVPAAAEIARTPSSEPVTAGVTIEPAGVVAPSDVPGAAAGPVPAGVAALAGDDISAVTPAAAAARADVLAACREAYDRHRWHTAADACAGAFEAAPADASLALKVAQAQHARAHYADAGIWAQRAIALEDVDPEAFVILAHAERRARHPAAAKSAYRHYLILAPRGWHAAEARAALHGARAENHLRAARSGAGHLSSERSSEEPLAQGNSEEN